MTQTTSQIVWEKTNLFEIKPKWPTEPSLDTVKLVAQRALHLEHSVEVIFLAQGAFNKLYNIKLPSEEPEYILRVTLPVDHITKRKAK
jgi:hypothetical protein